MKSYKLTRTECALIDFEKVWVILNNHADMFVPNYKDDDFDWSWEINIINKNDEYGLIFDDGFNGTPVVFSWPEVAKIISDNLGDQFSPSQA